MTDRFPDVFLIGAPKCGTTSLFSWLQQHPDTWLPVKEPNFLSPDILDARDEYGAITDEAAYLARLCPPEAAGRLTGEATPKYLYSEAALTRLSAHADRVRLIVMLRNPVDLAIAMHAQSLRQGREPEPDFWTAWTRGPATPGDRLTDYAFWGRPGVWLDRYLAAFPPGRIRVLILEEQMRHDPQAAHAEILSYLGLAPQVLDSYAVRNRRKAYRSARLQGASRRARRAVYRMLGRIGIRPGGTGALRLLDRINADRDGPAPVPDAIRRRVAMALAEDARRIAAALGRPLPWPDFDTGADLGRDTKLDTGLDSGPVRKELP